MDCFQTGKELAIWRQGVRAHSKLVNGLSVLCCHELWRRDVNDSQIPTFAVKPLEEFSLSTTDRTFAIDQEYERYRCHFSDSRIIGDENSAAGAAGPDVHSRLAAFCAAMNVPGNKASKCGD